MSGLPVWFLIAVAGWIVAAITMLAHAARHRSARGRSRLRPSGGEDISEVIERAIAVDALVAVAFQVLAAITVLTSETAALELIILISILGFLGTVAVARYVQQLRGDR